MTRSILLGLAIALAATAAPAAGIYSVVKEHSTLRYDVKHKLHVVSAESHEMEGKALLKPDGSVQLMVRAPVTSFRSGDGNRDEHMQETMDAQAFPYVVYKGVAKIQPPTSYPATMDVAVAGELDFHGRKHPETVQLKVEMRSATDWHVTGGFIISLDKYQVERPSLLLIKLEDACKIDLDLQLAGA